MQIVFGTLPPDGFEEQHRRYGKAGNKPSLPSFFPVRGNQFSALDEDDHLDDENKENYTPIKEVRTLPETSCFPLLGVFCAGGWGVINAIWSKMFSSCENNPLPCVGQAKVSTLAQGASSLLSHASVNPRHTVRCEDLRQITEEETQDTPMKVHLDEAEEQNDEDSKPTKKRRRSSGAKKAKVQARETKSHDVVSSEWNRLWSEEGIHRMASMHMVV